MSIYKDLLNETKARFEGKRVLKVDSDYKFHMDDGSCFYLDYSREAGLFTKDAPGSDGLCKSLDMWFEQYSRSIQYNEVPVIISQDELTLVIIGLNDAEFKLDISALSEKERRFVNTTELDDLAELAPMGDCWICGVNEVDGNLVIKGNWKSGFLNKD